MTDTDLIEYAHKSMSSLIDKINEGTLTESYLLLELQHVNRYLKDQLDSHRSEWEQ